jgi:hypothetical protein
LVKNASERCYRVIEIFVGPCGIEIPSVITIAQGGFVGDTKQLEVTAIIKVCRTEDRVVGLAWIGF